MRYPLISWLRFNNIYILCLNIIRSRGFKLTRTHREHIENTAKEEVAKMKQFGKSDKEHAGSQMYKTITSKEWRDNFNKENEQKSALVRTVNSAIATLQKYKREAKSLDEVVKVIVQEQGYLLGIGNQQPRHTSERIRELVVGAEENDRNNSIEKLKQELSANIKHGIIKKEQLYCFVVLGRLLHD